MLPRPDRRTLISRVLPAITLVVLSVLNGCQWCPAPTDRQTGSVNGNPTAVPTNPEPKGRGARLRPFHPGRDWSGQLPMQSGLPYGNASAAIWRCQPSDSWSPPARRTTWWEMDSYMACSSSEETKKLLSAAYVLEMFNQLPGFSLGILEPVGGPDSIDLPTQILQHRLPVLIAISCSPSGVIGSSVALHPQ